MTSPRTLLIQISILAATGAGCGDPEPPPRFPVTFAATSDPGVPVAGVVLTANGAALGETHEDGSLRVDLTGVEGSPVQIGATCPEGHRAPTSLPVITLRRVVSLDPVAADRGLQVSIACAPSTRHGVVVVRAAGDVARGDLPVMIDGREVARTDPSGVAHVALDMQPGATFQVLLATATDLRPQDPRRTFTFPDSDEIFVFDQSFEARLPPPRRGPRGPRGPRRPPQRNQGPIRIQ